MSVEAHPPRRIDPELRGWIDRYGEELERHVASMLPDRSDADDVLQEVWVAAHRHPPEDRAGAGMRPWLYRVATNAALDRLSRRGRRRRMLGQRQPEVHGDPTPAPDAGLERLGETDRRRVREAIARLPERQRHAVWLRWIEGEEYDAIARRVGGTAAAARANVYQGLKTLRRELLDVWKEVESS